MRKLPRYITQEEFEKLFESAGKLNTKNKKEYQLAMLLGFESGMRISEIVGLQKKGEWIINPLSKEQIEDAQIRIIQGKGRKDRIVPRPKRMNENAIKLLPLKLGRRSLQNLVTNLGLKVLNKSISFHSLRHGFGSHLAGQNRPLHEIQMLMGHSRLDTTGIYLHANPKAAVDGARSAF